MQEVQYGENGFLKATVAQRTWSLFLQHVSQTHCWGLRKDIRHVNWGVF